jgi:hypothetical protein
MCEKIADGAGSTAGSICESFSLIALKLWPYYGNPMSLYLLAIVMGIQTQLFKAIFSRLNTARGCGHGYGNPSPVLP